MRREPSRFTMLGELTIEESEQILREEVVGRLGCHGRGRTYVVPVTYAYDGSSIFGHTGDGLKVRMMRENPEVCLEVEQLADLPSWRSVIAFGRFEELSGEEASHALELLRARFHARTGAHGREPHEAVGLWVPGEELTQPRQMIAYAIRVHEITGRAERAGATAPR